ncbi:hypothetical protein NDU88_011454 [Pleurodeles waltl]|uniref:Uncharacterized protein n=1 Tax=Pleurodeles waltl TaxID=8319 RepID=A0AAV7Q1D7_PLEWA|nr:hypothetical protein NDU88_011454 [Pleurodeles waltl]
MILLARLVLRLSESSRAAPPVLVLARPLYLPQGAEEGASDKASELKLRLQTPSATAAPRGLARGELGTMYKALYNKMRLETGPLLPLGDF